MYKGYKYYESSRGQPEYSNMEHKSNQCPISEQNIVIRLKTLQM